MSAEFVQMVGATLTPATGRPCSSRTTPPIVSVGYIARVYDAGISSSRIGLGNQSVIGANPSLRTTTDRNPAAGMGMATAARPALSVVVRSPGFRSTFTVSVTPGRGLPVRWSTTRKSTVGPSRSPAGSWDGSAGRTPWDATRAGASLPSRANEPASGHEPGRADGQDDRSAGEEGRRQLELRDDHRPDTRVGQLERRRRGRG